MQMSAGEDKELSCFLGVAVIRLAAGRLTGRLANWRLFKNLLPLVSPAARKVKLAFLRATISKDNNSNDERL